MHKPALKYQTHFDFATENICSARRVYGDAIGECMAQVVLEMPSMGLCRVPVSECVWLGCNFAV